MILSYKEEDVCVYTIVDSWGSINKDEHEVSFYFFSGEVINLMRFSLLCMSREEAEKEKKNFRESLSTYFLNVFLCEGKRRRN